jgi:CRISPR-associated endonuclease/helicase Cas3
VEGGTPAGAYRTATSIARQFLSLQAARPDALHTLEAYYRRLFPLLDPDAEAIQERRAAFDYPEVARRYRLIEDDTEAVVVTSYPDDAVGAGVREVLEDARLGRANPRRTLRRLQPYIVSVRRRDAERLRARGLIEAIAPGLGEWHGEYDPVRGLVIDSHLESMVV